MESFTKMYLKPETSLSFDKWNVAIDSYSDVVMR